MRRVTDLSTLLGIGIALFLIAYSITNSKSDPAGFLDLPSALIVVVGTVFIIVACFSFNDVWRTKGLIARTIFYQSEDPGSAAVNALEIADIARKKGVLSLQKTDALNGHSPFFRKGVAMIMDGIPPEEAEAVMRGEIAATSERHKTGTSILRKASEISPAMGLIGTLIGLVQMLSNLNDPSSIGPSMAVALLTTFYGAILAYVVFIPLATKLERNSNAELMIMRIYIEAVGSIGRKENPRRLEMVVNALLPPSKRVNYFA